MVNAENAGVAVISHNEHAEEFLGKTSDKPDFVVLDPPRSGLGAEAAAKLAALGAALRGLLQRALVCAETQRASLAGP